MTTLLGGCPLLAERPCLGNPDPPASLNPVRVLDPRVGLVYYPPAVPVIVDPFSKLRKSVPSLHMVREPTVRELKPLARSDEVGILTDRPAVGQPYATPPALCWTAVPPLSDVREGIPFLHVVPLKPL